MINPSEGINPEYDPGKEIYSDLTEYITYVFDDAFDLQYQQGDKGYVEYIRIDTHSIGQPLFSTLLSESGGKPDKGAETLRLLARPISPEVTVHEAAEQMEDPDALVFQHNEFFVINQDRTGTKSYFRVDDNGIYPWVPKLKDLLLDEQNPEYEINDEDILDFLSSTGISREDFEQQKSLERIDRQEAEIIIGKIDQWSIIPQN